MFKKFVVKANGIQIDAYTKTATEAAKFISIYLLHRCKLQEFSSGAESEMVEVEGPTDDFIQARFLAWFTTRNGKQQIILQSKYVRRVSFIIVF
jgi:hypothetical protein